MNGGYYRRTFGNQTFTDDLRYDANSYDSFCITAPVDPDLPGGGGYQVCGVQDLKPAVFAQNLPANSLIRFSDDFGGETNLYQGFDVNLEARFRNGAFLKGGIGATARTFDNCNLLAAGLDAVVAAHGAGHRNLSGRLDERAIANTRYRPDVKLSGSYTLPWDIQLAGTYQFSRGVQTGGAGPSIQANWAVTERGRAAATSARNLDRRRLANHSADSRGPGLRRAQPEPARPASSRSASPSTRYRLRVDFDLYNVFNSSWPYTVSTTYSTAATGQWLRPTNVLQNRFFKLGAQLSF